MKQNDLNRFLEFIPSGARNHVQSIILQENILLHLSPSRKTKWGHFKALRNGTGTPEISINRDLSPPAFLLTFIHEWAHFLIWKSRIKCLPHGLEWKVCYRDAMQPLLNTSVFEPNLLEVTKRFLNNPTANITASPELYALLRDGSESEITVDQIQIGSQFLFRGKIYVRAEKRRTRIRCVLVENKKSYLFRYNTPVDPLQNNNH